MAWLGGHTGIAAGSTYAAAQSASMGGAATGVVATVGGMSVGGFLAAATIVAGAVYFAVKTLAMRLAGY
jgi:hypothetical protein